MSYFLCTVLTCVAVRQCIKVQKWIMEEMDIRRELLGCWWSQSLCSVNMFLTVVKGNAGEVHILVQSFSHEYRGKKNILCFWIILKEKGAAKEGSVLQWQTGKNWGLTSSIWADLFSGKRLRSVMVLKLFFLIAVVILLRKLRLCWGAELGASPTRCTR